MSNEFWTRNEQEQYSQRMEDEHHRQNKRIDILEKNYGQLTELTMSVREQTMVMDTMSKEIKRQGEQINKIVNEPANRWQKIKDKAIDTAVGIIIGALVVGLVIMMAQNIK